MIELIGFEALEKLTSAQQSAEIDRAVGMALTMEAQVMMRNSLRIVPIDSGTLRRSHRILPLAREGSGWVIEMGYGGAASEYALEQHENPDYRHAEGKSWKYLETPVRERVPVFETMIAKKVTQILRNLS
jgi:hypothetical protein